ncbi:hypothetical protein COB55_03610 [Candidatus Wolfebacteria bacterium]|nr:MAG: hypothetical protein COB55_03610 [Candidatus Wolfebacteria bacterium]
MTEECKKEIEEYVVSRGWIEEEYGCLFIGDSINDRYFYMSKKGEERRMGATLTGGEFDRYLLNYISPILNKHKITIVSISHETYKSTDWKFDNIDFAE